MGKTDKKPLISKIKNYLPIIIIILIALFLRLHNIQYMEFKGDEAFNSIKASNLAGGKEFPLTASIGTTGIHEPPIFIYLLAIQYLISKNPVMAAAFIAILNVFAIFLLYSFIKKFYNRTAAIIASALYAVNPWQILFSRKIWSQDLLPLFAIIFIYFLYNAIYDKNKLHLIYALITLGLLIQTHLSALYFLLVAIIAIALYWKNINKKYLSIGIILFLITFIPYFIFQINNDFVDIKTIINLKNTESNFHTNTFLMPFSLMTTNGFEALFGEDYNKFESQTLTIKFFDILAMSILFLSIAFLLAYKKKSIILVLWLLVGTFFLAISKVQTIDSHYFVSFFPLYFIMIGTAIALLMEAFPKIAKNLIIILILLILAYQINFDIKFLNFQKNNECINGDYGMPYQYRLRNIESAMEKYKTSDIEEINKISCNCRKCDLKAAEFITDYIKA